jgi:O-antigen/teichoic acid export membrane protein
MGVIARQSFKSGIVTYLGIVLGMMNTVLFYPYFLTVEQIGVLSFIAQVSVLFMPFILLGFSNVLVRYFAYYQDSKDSRNYFYSFLILVVSISTLVFVLSYLFFFKRIETHFQDDIEISKVTLLVLMGVASIMPITEIFQQYCSSYKRTAVPSMLNQLYKFITPFLAGGYFLGWYSFDFVLIGVFVYYLSLAIVYKVYLNKLEKLQFKLPKINELVADSKMKPMFAYAIFGLVGGLGYSFSNQIDILMLTDMSGTYQTGIYSWAFNIANSISTPLTLIAAIAMPLIAAHWKHNDLEAIKKIYKQSSSTLFVISLGLFFAVLIGIDDLFALMPKGDKFAASKTTFIILGSAKLIDLAAGLNNQIITMSKHYLYNVLFMIVTALINVFLNWLFIPMYGLEGCAYATLISIFMFNLIKLVFIQVKFKMQPLNIKMLATLFIGLALWYAILHMPHFNHHLVNLAFYSILFLFVYSFINYKLKLSPEINVFINKQLIRIGIKPFD